MKNKVTKITKMDKKSSYGETSYIIEFGNGDKGFYSTKAEEQRAFVVGQEADYDIEKKVGQTGKEYFKVTIPSEQKSGGFKGGKASIDPKVQMVSFAMSYTKDLMVAKVITFDQMDATFEKMYKIMTSKV
jgi:hypothetical protein